MDTDDLLQRARSRVGSVLKSKYRLDRVLGVGGMASVYAATHLRNANRVAVKVLHREISLEPELRRRFLREGYAANSVEHPGTVRVLDDDVADDGSVFFVMELLDGETVEARWERNGRRLEATEVAKLLIGVLDVLSAAHRKGIVHRDIKPENLFVTRDGDVRVLDFGVARLGGLSATRTRTGAVFGTPAFLPPEQALGRSTEVDAQSDVWSVGATAFTLLSGRFVHEGRTAEEILVRAATQPAPLLTTLLPDVSPNLANIVDRALSFEKAARWPSADAMRDALAHVEESRATLALVGRKGSGGARLDDAAVPGPSASEDRASHFEPTPATRAIPNRANDIRRDSPTAQLFALVGANRSWVAIAATVAAAIAFAGLARGALRAGGSRAPTTVAASAAATATASLGTAVTDPIASAPPILGRLPAADSSGPSMTVIDVEALPSAVADHITPLRLSPASSSEPVSSRASTPSSTASQRDRAPPAHGMVVPSRDPLAP